MRPTTRRVVLVCTLLFVASAIGLVLSDIYEWPAQLGGGTGRSEVTFEDDFVGGSVLALPLAPWIALTLFAVLARSRQWWGTLAVVGLCLLGALFIFGGLGEAFAPDTPFVPRAVLIAAGVIYGGLGLALVVTAILDLRDRLRSKRQSGRRSTPADAHLAG